MRNPTLPLGLSYLLLVSSMQIPAQASQSSGQEQSAQKPASTAQQQSQPTTAPPTDTEKTLAPGQFILQDGTPVKLRLNRNVSSADAHEGESVDFEVLEDVAANGTLVIPKGLTAIGTVTEAQPKRRMGRAGNLEIVLDYVRLKDTEKAAIRAVKDAKGGSHTAGMTAGIVATGLLFFPAAPFFLFMHGKDITVPKGAEITAYINGDVRLETAKFVEKPASAEAAVTASANPPQADPQVPAAGSVELRSTPDGAEVYVDGAFVGNAPATLKLSRASTKFGCRQRVGRNGRGRSQYRRALRFISPPRSKSKRANGKLRMFARNLSWQWLRFSDPGCSPTKCRRTSA